LVKTKSFVINNIVDTDRNVNDSTTSYASYTKHGLIEYFVRLRTRAITSRAHHRRRTFYGDFPRNSASFAGFSLVLYANWRLLERRPVRQRLSLFRRRLQCRRINGSNIRVRTIPSRRLKEKSRNIKEFETLCR